MEISVIIPTYGHPDFLKKAIESVQKQTFEKWELIIVDDNNPETDARKETERIVREFMNNDKRIIYIQHEYNKNGAVARNTGFAVAQGKYVALLDSDDEYLPERLSRCYDVMQNAPREVAGVYTGCEFRRGGKPYHIYTYVKTGNFLKETLASRFMFCTGSNIFVRKSVIDELHGFDPSFLRKQDYEFLVRLFERYTLIGMQEVLVIKNNENYNVPSIKKTIEIREKYLGKFNSVIKSLPIQSQNFIWFWNCISLAESAMSQKEYRIANGYYKKAREYGRLPLKTWLRRICYPMYNLIK